MKLKYGKILLVFFTIFHHQNTFAQSFDEEKVAMTNFVKRMYQSSPFEGGKVMEGEEGTYHVIAIPAISSASSTNEKKAQETASTAFAEPFIKFEMIAQMENPKRLLYYCQPLSQFVKHIYQKEAFDGARIIASPINNYFIAVVSLDPSRYPNSALMDRAALMKSNQQANTLFNGSKISSNLIIVTEQNNQGIRNSSMEVVLEQSMGYIEGLAALTKFELNNKKVYVFYRALNRKNESN